MTHDQYTAEREASRRRATTLLDAAKAEYDSWLESIAPSTGMLGRPRKAGPRKKQSDRCSVPGCHGKRNFTGGLCIHHHRLAHGIPSPMVPCGCGCGRQAQRATAEKNGGMRAECWHRARARMLKARAA